MRLRHVAIHLHQQQQAAHTRKHAQAFHFAQQKILPTLATRMAAASLLLVPLPLLLLALLPSHHHKQHTVQKDKLRTAILALCEHVATTWSLCAS